MADSEEPGDTGRSERGTKVSSLITEYGLEGLGAELERRWTAEGDDRMSLRDLAAYFNKEVLSEAMADAGMQPLAGEVANLYRLLTADDVSEADRMRARRRLEREGVDTDRLLDAFVTYQAVRTYLKSDRGAEYESDDRDRVTVEAEHIRRLRGQTATVTEAKLDHLRSGGHLGLGEFQLLVDINVLCEECNTRLDVEELLERGGCDCSEPIE